MSDAIPAKPLEIGLLFFPGMTQLDVTGPFEVFARLPNARVHLLWKRIEPVVSDVGLPLVPTTTFADCPDLDVLCVGGGPGQVAVMDDDELLAFLRDKGGSARYLTSVCAGSLMLGGAGLLDGYRSACHWLLADQLAAFGAIPVDERVVVDRNRISGGGVTAGIDFGFQVAALLCGEEVARRLQLFLEYQPQPPFDITVQNAPAELLRDIRTAAATMVRERAEAGRRALAKRAARKPEAA
ncbi:DJ-1/PfpI family protein [Phreatobacter sp. AB_2022a]|uniref:DJ-1/PfpI family protein n=1 Tax=Phreatobacter sp. AB_2022a TaxID=3003134 RepID=UPI0022870AF3|nr:DJ-1/PfpI family protein [Phreatobacter sp. AB_2022a]MCZ0734122.1 DJ-1/PfpI family protein [Phreatobacter sp. AB_2022a]